MILAAVIFYMISIIDIFIYEFGSRLSHPQLLRGDNDEAQRSSDIGLRIRIQSYDIMVSCQWAQSET